MGAGVLTALILESRNVMVQFPMDHLYSECISMDVSIGIVLRREIPH